MRNFLANRNLFEFFSVSLYANYKSGFKKKFQVASLDVDFAFFFITCFLKITLITHTYSREKRQLLKTWILDSEDLK